MTTTPLQKWSRGMHLFWWLIILLFIGIAVLLIADFVADIYSNRAVKIGLLANGIISLVFSWFIVDLKAHPERMLDEHGNVRSRRWRV